MERSVLIAISIASLVSFGCSTECRGDDFMCPCGPLQGECASQEACDCVGTGGSGGVGMGGSGGAAGAAGAGGSAPPCDTSCGDLACVGFSDGTFNEGDWTDAELSASGTASYTARTESDDGNPAPYRFIAHTVAENSIISVGHEKPSAVYDPADGAIESIHYSVDAKALAGNQASVSVLAEQNDNRFRSDSQLINEGEGWVTSTWTDQDLTPVGTLDFSVNGGPITFGFATAASHTEGVPEVTRETGVDNWVVHICLAP